MYSSCEGSQRRVSAAAAAGEQGDLRLPNMERFSIEGEELHGSLSRQSSHSSMVSVATNIRCAPPAAAAHSRACQALAPAPGKGCHPSSHAHSRLCRACRNLEHILLAAQQQQLRQLRRLQQVRQRAIRHQPHTSWCATSGREKEPAAQPSTPHEFTNFWGLFEFTAARMVGAMLAG